ncbi:MAG: hypothetical protein JRE40_13815 [Deltaproteobacteria bacterium]|nr:hypothetical protein [Deltaproteobacteria bacterium]
MRYRAGSTAGLQGCRAVSAVGGVPPAGGAIWVRAEMTLESVSAAC